MILVAAFATGCSAQKQAKLEADAIATGICVLQHTEAGEPADVAAVACAVTVQNVEDILSAHRRLGAVEAKKLGAPPCGSGKP